MGADTDLCCNIWLQLKGNIYKAFSILGENGMWTCGEISCNNLIKEMQKYLH